MKVTNRNNVQLPMAAWIVNNDYDYISTPNYISVTSLLRSTRQIVLGRRLTESKEIDVQDLAASSLGAAMHDSIERVWTEGNYKQAMKVLGYPESMINNIVINPTSVEEGQIPVYLEQRTIKSFGGWEIGGKFDVIFDGELEDYKSTSTYSYINNSKSKDYTLQGSIYRWLNQDKVQEDFISINFYFTNWTAKDEEMYGIQRVMSKAYMLMPIAQTEAWIKSKLSEIESNMNLPEPQVKECTKEELWMTPSVYKYYSDPTKTDGRATKNFDSLVEANMYASDKGKGVVLTQLGTAKACSYCPVFDICTQKDKLNHD